MKTSTEVEPSGRAIWCLRPPTRERRKGWAWIGSSLLRIRSAVLPVFGPAASRHLRSRKVSAQQSPPLPLCWIRSSMFTLSTCNHLQPCPLPWWPPPNPTPDQRTRAPTPRPRIRKSQSRDSNSSAVAGNMSHTHSEFTVNATTSTSGSGRLPGVVSPARPAAACLSDASGRWTAI